MDREMHLYLCSYCNNMFEAPANSIDRTRECRCPTCLGCSVTAYFRALSEARAKLAS